MGSISKTLTSNTSVKLLEWFLKNLCFLLDPSEKTSGIIRQKSLRMILEKLQQKPMLSALLWGKKRCSKKENKTKGNKGWTVM